MPYVVLPATARRSPLGPGRLNTWLTNLAWLREGFAKQHLASTGEHNTMEVSRVTRRIAFSAGVYSLADASTDITAVTRVAAGHIRLTLAAGRFTAGDIRPQINVNGPGAETKPWLPRFEVTSATQVEVYLLKLSSALGAGNAWVADDESFDIALHSQPLTATQWATCPFGPGRRFPATWTRGQTVGAPGYYSGSAQDFNETLWGQANWRAQFTAEHDTDGNHATRQVARHFVQGRYKSAGIYDKIQQLSAFTISLSEIATGQVQVTFSSALTAGISCFVAPDWTRQDAGVGSSGNLTVIHAVVDSTTQTTLWMYRYDRTTDTWARARADFWAVWHGG